jgi:hypothetical protein
MAAVALSAAAADMAAYEYDEQDELRDEGNRLAAQLAKAHQVLRALRKIEPKPARAEGFEDDPQANMIVGYATALAAIRARIELYLATVPEVR